MIAFPKPVVCCDCPCPCGCCNVEPIEVTFELVDAFQCDECDQLRREEGGGTVTVTPID